MLLPPTAAQLREIALAHLARYSTSAARLIRVLDRRIDRWARQQPEPVPEQEAEAKQAARAVAASLTEAGVLDDAAFAAARARRLVRGGRSRAAVAAHLAARGVAAEVVKAAVPEDRETELAAALAVARRRRIGPFRDSDAAPDADALRREFAVLARAGFSQALAAEALRMDAEAAETLVLALRRG